MSDKIFIDTNVLIYFISAEEEKKQIIENNLKIINPFEK